MRQSIRFDKDHTVHLTNPGALLVTVKKSPDHTIIHVEGKERNVVTYAPGIWHAVEYHEEGGVTVHFQ